MTDTPVITNTTAGLRKQLELSECKPNHGCSPQGCVCGIAEDALDRLQQLEKALQDIIEKWVRYDEDPDDEFFEGCETGLAEAAKIARTALKGETK